MELTYQKFWRRLVPLYGEQEAKAIARMVYETRYGLTLADLYMERDRMVDSDDAEPLLQRLENHEPVQYVLGQATFFGRSFHVEPGVLIPRPETELLCRRVVDVAVPMGSGLRVLDIGTGSGCLAVTLALELAGSRVTAWDVSPEALRIASGNASQLGASVTFRQTDMLREVAPASPVWDVIVSNPPYVCESEAEDMSPHVLHHEPSLALFVPDDDPLLFYRAIMRYALAALVPGGRVFLEANTRYVTDVVRLLWEHGFSQAEAVDDQFGKPRFIEARR